MLETELKYFIPKRNIGSLKILKKNQNSKLWQRYLENKNITKAFKLLFPNLIEKFNFTTARIRFVRKGHKSQYFATFKGPYLNESSRIEIERKIDVKIFKSLNKLCRGVTVHKIRYYIPGWVLNTNNKKIKITAEIDHLIDWSSEFFTVDLELPSEKLIKNIRLGHHSFDFLKCCAIELNRELTQIRKPLSMKYLSQNGFNQKTKNIVRLLLKKIS